MTTSFINAEEHTVGTYKLDVKNMMVFAFAKMISEETNSFLFILEISRPELLTM